MKSVSETMSAIYTQLSGQNRGVLPLVEACNLILDYVLENGFGSGNNNPLTPTQINKIKQDIINQIKTQVPIGVMLKDCELLDSKLKYTLSDNSNKELDLTTLINKAVKEYVDTHKSELKGDRGLKGDTGERGSQGVAGKSAYDLWKEKGNTGTEQDFLNSLKGVKGETGQQGLTGETAFELWKRIKNRPTANENDFLQDIKGQKGDTGNKGADGVQGQKGNDGVGVTNIEKVGDKLKITLSDGQVKEFTLPNGQGGTQGLNEQEVKNLINIFYKPSIDEKLKRGNLDTSITAETLKATIDSNSNKLTKTITELRLDSNSLKYKENNVDKTIVLPTGNSGLNEQQVKQLIDTNYVPSISSKLEKGSYVGTAKDLEDSISDKVNKSELQTYAKKTDIVDFVKTIEADNKYTLKTEFNPIKTKATTELTLVGNDLKFKENEVEKVINLPISNGGGVTEEQVKSIIDRDYKPSIDSKAEKSELDNYAKQSEIINFITETKADSKYQVKGDYATQTELDNKLDASTYESNKLDLEKKIGDKQDKATAVKIEDVKSEIQKIVGTAPEALNTLQEIAEALGNDPNKINTILTQLGLKADKSELNTLKDKAITEISFENNKIKYKENSLSKEIDLSSYVNQSKEQIETIVETKGNTLYEPKDNTIVKDLKFDTNDKKITYKENNVNKEIKLPDGELPNGDTILTKINNDVQKTAQSFKDFKNKLEIPSPVDISNCFMYKGTISEDLNTLKNDTDVGYYNVTTATNKPEESEFALVFVYKYMSYIMQKYIINSQKIYIRLSGDDGLNWSNWEKISSDNSNLRIKFNSNNSATFLSDNTSFFINPETVSGNTTISEFKFMKGNTSEYADVYAGKINASGKLLSQDEIISSGDITAFSDIRLKTNIEKIENALDKVCELSGYTYDMNNQRHSGVIAQEVEKVLPEVVKDREDGYKTVAYGNMVGLLIEAIKELKQEIEALKNGN